MNIKKLIKKYGGPSYIGDYVGVSRQAVSQWTKIPLEHVVKFEELTGKPRQKLRSDKAWLWKGMVKE